MKKLRKLPQKIDDITLASYVLGGQIAIIVYTAIVTVLATITGNDYTGYYIAFCGVFGSEQALCAWLKKLKKKKVLMRKEKSLENISIFYCWPNRNALIVPDHGGFNACRGVLHLTRMGSLIQGKA